MRDHSFHNLDTNVLTICTTGLPSDGGRSGWMGWIRSQLLGTASRGLSKGHSSNLRLKRRQNGQELDDGKATYHYRQPPMLADLEVSFMTHPNSAAVLFLSLIEGKTDDGCE